MDLHLDGARALVTGGSRGLGLAIASSLAAEGASVAIVARDRGGLERAVKELASAGRLIVPVTADVTDAQQLAAAVDEAAAGLGGLDRVVANVGGTVGNNLVDSTMADFAATFALNAGHAAELTRLALPHLRAAGGGSVVYVSSVTGMRPAPRTAYAAAKAAEIHLAVTAAQELAPYRIRVNAVSPGSIRFPGGGWESFAERNPERYAAFVAEEFPHGRLGSPAEVGDVVAFLLSDRASWVTGTNIVIDGGQGRPSAARFPMPD
jgi:3-oxoacyl-[acyl-carrier protein] reductase